MKILLLCAAGMSTSLVVDEMISALPPNKNDWVIDAKPVDYFDELVTKYDVILLGPQMTFKKEELKSKADKKGVPIDVIDAKAYGLGDGETILRQVEELVIQKGEK